MVDLAQLLSLNVGLLQDSADGWLAVSKRLRAAREAFRDEVLRPLRSGTKWSGDDAMAAVGRCEGIQLDIEAVAIEAEAVQRFLDDVAAGSGDGFGNLHQHQQRALQLQQEARDKGFTVEADGHVVWAVMRAPGPLSPRELQLQNEIKTQAAAIEKELKRILKAVSNIDDSLARGLKVIFGTEDTFRTESRIRSTGDSNWDDWWNEEELWEITGLLYLRGWTDASKLLKHYLEASGQPFEVDVSRMLREIPAFQRDVEATVAAELRQHPNDGFKTEWLRSKPNIEDGDTSLNWYYALNNFRYKITGDTVDGQTTYHVEVYKEYNWGMPSEHRRDLDEYVYRFEQAEIARLNMVGKAKDFTVEGKTGPITVDSP